MPLRADPGAPRPRRGSGPAPGTALDASRAGPGRAGQSREGSSSSRSSAMAFARWWYAMVSEGKAPAEPGASRAERGAAGWGEAGGMLPAIGVDKEVRKGGCGAAAGETALFKKKVKKKKSPSASGRMVSVPPHPIHCQKATQKFGVLVLFAVLIVALVTQAGGVVRPHRNA